MDIAKNAVSVIFVIILIVIAVVVIIAIVIATELGIVAESLHITMGNLQDYVEEISANLKEIAKGGFNQGQQ